MTDSIDSDDEILADETLAALADRLQRLETARARRRYAEICRKRAILEEALTERVRELEEEEARKPLWQRMWAGCLDGEGLELGPPIIWITFAILVFIGAIVADILDIHVTIPAQSMPTNRP